MSQEIKTLRKVEWVNSWDEIRASNADGYGTKAHLTQSLELEGKTLCGKAFPRWKGYQAQLGKWHLQALLQQSLEDGL